jgi:hypothetical protein
MNALSNARIIMCLVKEMMLAIVSVCLAMCVCRGEIEKPALYPMMKSVVIISDLNQNVLRSYAPRFFCPF